MDGLAPLKNGPVADYLMHESRRRRRLAGNRRTADGTRGRFSYARNCARQMAMNFLGLPKSNETSGSSLDAFFVGQKVHDELQYSLERHFGVRKEVKVSWRDTFDVSGHLDGYSDLCPIDAVYKPTAWEIKSNKNYGFRKATGQSVRVSGGWDRFTPGPSIPHITQVAMGGLAPYELNDDDERLERPECEQIYIIYWDKDNADKAEWVIGMDDPIDYAGDLTPREMAMAELTRMQKIMDALDDGRAPKRNIPGEGDIEDPSLGRKNGGFWQCDFCDYLTTCVEAGPGILDVSSLRTVAELNALPNDPIKPYESVPTRALKATQS